MPEGDVKDAEYLDGYLKIRPGLPYQDWHGIWQAVQHMDENRNWYMGDALNYGEATYGEIFSQVVDAEVADKMRGVQWVCKNIEPVRRYPWPKLRYTHHKLVASLVPDLQDELLARAYRDHLSTRELNELVKGLRPKPKAVEQPELPGTDGKEEEDAAATWPANSGPEDEEGGLPERRDGDDDGGDGFGDPPGEVAPLHTQVDLQGVQTKLAQVRARTDEMAGWLRGGTPELDIVAILDERDLLWQAVESAQDMLHGSPIARVSLRAAIAKLEQLPGLTKKLMETA